MTDTTTEIKIWGLLVEEIYSGELLWEIKNLRKDYFEAGRMWAGVNEKLLNRAVSRGVSRIFSEVNGRHLEIPMMNLSKTLKQKVKLNEFKDIPSKFEGSPPMRIYLFEIK